MEKSDKKLWLVTIIIALGLTLLSIILHATSPSSLGDSEQIWQERLTYHLEHNALNVRVLTSGWLLFASDNLGLSVKTSFFTLQFLLLFLSGIAFWYYLKVLGFSTFLSRPGMIIYFLSYPIMLAHFEPIFTWSDFWLYLFIPLGFALSWKKNYIFATLFFILSFFARETTVVFYPLWLYLIWLNENKKLNIKLLYPIFALIVIALMRVSFFNASSGQVEWKLWFNFENSARSSDTIFSLIASLGAIWVLGLIAIKTTLKSNLILKRFFIYGALITVPVFFISTLLVAQARETRLFFPPYIFLIPLTLIYFDQNKYSFQKFFERFSLLTKIIGGIILLIVGIYLSKFLFPTFEYRDWHDGAWIFLGMNLTVIFVWLIYLFYRKKLSKLLN